MRKREGQKRDLLSGWSAALIRLCVLFLGGGLVGSVFVGIFPDDDAGVLTRYLLDFMMAAESGEVLCAFPGLLWLRIRDLLVAVLLGVSVAGVFGLPLFMGLQGFFLASSVGAFCMAFGWPGLLPAAVLFGVPAMLWCPALLLVCVQGLDSAGALLHRREWGSAAASTYWLRILLGCGIAAACAVLEYTVVPQLLKRVVWVLL